MNKSYSLGLMKVFYVLTAAFMTVGIVGVCYFNIRLFLFIGLLSLVISLVLLTVAVYFTAKHGAEAYPAEKPGHKAY